MRNYFLNTITECARRDPKVALLMAEVGFSVVEPFEKEFPDRFYNTGISEQNLVLTSAGLAISGMHPIAYSMASFLPSRALEMIKVSICYQNLPVVLLSIGSGLSYGEMGATHHAIEESAIMRSLPNLNVIFPSDGFELRDALKYALKDNRPYYISFPKLKAPEVAEHKFEFGKAVKHREGKDGAILAAGFSVNNALKASETLSEKGIHLSVYGLHTVKPLDRQALFEASKTRNVFVIDEHNYAAGIGGEISRVILQSGMSVDRYHEFSIPDCFSEQVASYPEMLDMYHLSAERISEEIENLYKR